MVKNDELQTFNVSGIFHKAVGAHAHGVQSTEVWRQILTPEAKAIGIFQRGQS